MTFWAGTESVRNQDGIETVLVKMRLDRVAWYLVSECNLFVVVHQYSMLGKIESSTKSGTKKVEAQSAEMRRRRLGIYPSITSHLRDYSKIVYSSFTSWQRSYRATRKPDSEESAARYDRDADRFSISPPLDMAALYLAGCFQQYSSAQPW